MKEISVADVLGVGEKEAILGEQLMSICGFDNIRSLRERVEFERNYCGAVILTGKHGYFLPERDESGQLTAQGAADTRRFYRQQRAKGIGCLRSARSAGVALRAFDQRDQTSIPGV